MDGEESCVLSIKVRSAHLLWEQGGLSFEFVEKAKTNERSDVALKTPSSHLERKENQESFPLKSAGCLSKRSLRVFAL